MKAHLIRIAVIVLAVAEPLLAAPVAARPKDPDSLLVTPIRQGGCNFETSFGDPLNGLCPSGLPELAANQSVSWRPTDAQSLLRHAVDAVTGAGSLQYTLEMQITTTSIRGDLWMARSTFVGDSLTRDKLRGILSKGDTL